MRSRVRATTTLFAFRQIAANSGNVRQEILDANQRRRSQATPKACRFSNQPVAQSRSLRVVPPNTENDSASTARRPSTSCCQASGVSGVSGMSGVSGHIAGRHQAARAWRTWPRHAAPDRKTHQVPAAAAPAATADRPLHCRQRAMAMARGCLVLSVGAMGRYNGACWGKPALSRQ